MQEYALTLPGLSTKLYVTKNKPKSTGEEN